MKKCRTLSSILVFLLLFGCLCFSTLSHSQTKPRQRNDLQTAAGTVGIFDVKEFGAKGDGKMLDTPAINRAIEAAAAAGGGTVRFSAGTYRAFSIHLKSNVALYLDHGSIILAADA